MRIVRPSLAPSRSPSCSTVPRGRNNPASSPSSSRTSSRLLVRLDDGEEAGLFLPRGTVLHDGDLLGASDGRTIRIVAATEDVYRVHPSQHCSLAQAAYHLGNRHIPVQIGAGELT